MASHPPAKPPQKRPIEWRGHDQRIGTWRLTPSTEGAEPEFTEALEHIKAAAHKYHLALGMFSNNGEAAAERVRQGFQMISVTTDISSLIASATRNLHIARG